MRVDANVPLRDGVITDDGRLRAFLPTLQHLRDRGAVVYLLSHLGRPEGPGDSRFSLSPVADRLTELAGGDVGFVAHVSGAEAFAGAVELDAGSVRVLENVRFDPREVSADPAERLELATEWADFVDLVVSDGFGVVHRKHASVYELPSLKPSVAGFLVEKEVEVVTRLTSAVEHQ